MHFKVYGTNVYKFKNRLTDTHLNILETIYENRQKNIFNYYFNIST